MKRADPCGPAPSISSIQVDLDRLNVRRRLLAATVHLQLEADALAFGQIVHARTLDGADVNEGVRRAIVALNEAEALLTVEELNGALVAGAVARLTVETAATLAAE